MPLESPQGLGALRSLLPVSRETYERLALLVSLVRKWQKAENLVSPSTLGEIWTRHVADSAQLFALHPEARCWLDLGSGGGFPGLVTAILLGTGEARSDGHVHLVESNSRKCAFLRTAARETGAPAVVHHGRIEDVLANWTEPVDLISARALAPLPELLRLAGHLIAPERRALFPKGVDYEREIEEATQSYDIDLLVHPSRINEGSVILEVARAVPKHSGRTSGP
jgi:16S rRNA (guanine527-N7)-methyltransferase